MRKVEKREDWTGGEGRGELERRELGNFEENGVRGAQRGEKSIRIDKNG